MGGRGFEHRPGLKHFERGWRDAATAPRIKMSGFEHSAQLGATFLADAAQLRAWYGDSPALTDNHPKRLAAPPAHDEVPDEYAQWLVPETARRRFETSQWIARHWPAGSIRDSLPYFAVQPIVNGMIPPDPVRHLQLLDGILRNTDLRIPVLWLLGSDFPEQLILARRTAGDDPRRARHPEHAYPLGVRALVERDYARAAELFSQAAKEHSRDAGALAAYSWCRVGQARRAAAVPGADRLATTLRCWPGSQNQPSLR
jgi:hypothetical protein